MNAQQSNLNISLETRQFLDSQVQQGLARTSTEYVDALVQRERAAMDSLKAKILAGLNSPRKTLWSREVGFALLAEVQTADK